MGVRGWLHGPVLCLLVAAEDILPCQASDTNQLYLSRRVTVIFNMSKTARKAGGALLTLEGDSELLRRNHGNAGYLPRTHLYINACLGSWK